MRYYTEFSPSYPDIPDNGLRGAAFIGGECPPPEVCREAASRANIIVAADSGLDAAERASVRPDWIVGDMDSLKDADVRLARYPPDRVLRERSDKDFTDTELALRLLWDKGCAETILIGGGGGRLDHLLGIRALFDRFPSPDLWLTGAETVIRLKNAASLTMTIKQGGVVSVFPCAQAPWKARSCGLKWALDDLEWTSGFCGISNVAPEGQFSITSEQGNFLVIVSA